MDETTPTYQRLSSWIVGAFGGVLALGLCLDAINNASIIPLRVRRGGTVAVLLAWVLAEVVIRNGWVRWWVPGARLVKLKRLGPKPRAFFVGILALLWIHRVLPMQRPGPELILAPQGELLLTAPPATFEDELRVAAFRKNREAREYRDVGNRNFASFRYHDAIANYDRSLAALPTMSVYLSKAAAHQYVSEIEEALRANHAGLRLAKDNRSLVFQAAFLDQIASVHIDRSALELAHTAVLQAIETAHAADAALVESTARTHLGTVLLLSGKLHQAMAEQTRALAAFRRLQSTKGVAQALNNIGSVHYASGNHRTALETYESALEVHRQNGDLSGTAFVLHNIGNTYADQGDRERALDSYGKALGLARRIGDRLTEASAVNNMSDIRLEQGARHEALQLARQALSIFRSVGSPEGEGNAFLAIGYAHFAAGDLDSARTSWTNAVNRFRGRDLRGQTAALNNLAEVERNQGNLLLATQRAKSAFELATRTGARHHQISILLTLGNLASDQRKWQESRGYYHRALDAASAEGYRGTMCNALANLAFVSNQMGDPRGGLEFAIRGFELAQELADPVLSAFIAVEVGLSQAALGDSATAQRWLRRAKTLYNANPELKKHPDSHEQYRRIDPALSLLSG